MAKWLEFQNANESRPTTIINTDLVQEFHISKSKNNYNIDAFRATRGEKPSYVRVFATTQEDDFQRGFKELSDFLTSEKTYLKLESKFPPATGTSGASLSVALY